MAFKMRGWSAFTRTDLKMKKGDLKKDIEYSGDDVEKARLEGELNVVQAEIDKDEEIKDTL